MGGMAAEPGFGAQIRDARERRHMTQQELADVLRVDRKTVDNWEHGRTSPRNRTGALKDWAPELAGDGEELDPQEQEIMALDFLTPEARAWIIEQYRARKAAPPPRRTA